jgi:hypothetical protein
MPHSTRIAITATALICVVCALGISASAQITVTSPVNNSTLTSLPAQMTASVSQCNGSSNITLFGYSIDSSPFLTRSPNNGLSTQISNTEFRLKATASGTQHTIRFKAWSSAGECTENDVVVTVSGFTTNEADNVDDVANAASWNPNPCPDAQKSTSGLVGWFWVYDTGTKPCTCPVDTSKYAACTGTGTSTYTQSGTTIDGEARLFYVDWKGETSGAEPGERFSEVYGSTSTATHFVYDLYIYFTDPHNIQNLEMDMNQTDSSGNLYIYGVQCALNQWQYTTDSGGAHWNPTGMDCSGFFDSSNSANVWHHVQIAAHRVGTGATGKVYYDSATLDGKTETLNLSGVDSYFVKSPPWTANVLLLNFQVDGIYNGGSEATATMYVDGMTMMWY